MIRAPLAGFSATARHTVRAVVRREGAADIRAGYSSGEAASAVTSALKFGAKLFSSAPVRQIIGQDVVGGSPPRFLLGVNPGGAGLG